MNDNMDDRTKLMFDGALMILAATRGTDEDVWYAIEGGENTANYLGKKFGKEADAYVGFIKSAGPKRGER